MNNIKELDLASCYLHDTGASHLKWIAGIERLNLKDTGVGDLTLETLGSLERLQSVNLMGTYVSPAGVSRLIQLRRGNVDIQLDENFYSLRAKPR